MPQIVIHRSKGTHEGGTKSYHLTLIAIGDQRWLLKRWGKIGAYGQVEFEERDSHLLWEQYQGTIKQKGRRGYSFDAEENEEFDSLNSLRKHDSMLSVELDKAKQKYPDEYEHFRAACQGLGPDLETDPPEDDFVEPTTHAEPEREDIPEWGSW